MLLKSASKILLLTFGMTLAIAYLFSVLTGKISVGDTFDKAIMLVLGFYFAYKGENGKEHQGK